MRIYCRETHLEKKTVHAKFSSSTISGTILHNQPHMIFMHFKKRKEIGGKGGMGGVFFLDKVNN